jgi:Protein of unknown function, DUF547
MTLKFLTLAICLTISNFAFAAFDQSHKDLDTILKDVVVVNGAVSQVNYKKLSKMAVLFNKYLKETSKVTQKEFDTFNEKQQVAFLINSYNAFTLKLIVDNYPVKSIKKIGGILSSPWKMKFIVLLGKNRSLDEIEHEWLRKKYNEPRVHFAVNCASIGCPALRNEAYLAEKLDEQLTEQAKLFLRDGVRNQFDHEKKILKLSKIFDWFKEDFTKTGTLQAFVTPYLTDDPLLRKALESETYEIEFTDYDWDLNETK